jgi:Ca2+-transporting ATPase
VADMVLADDNFATIVAAVEEGRRIYDNIRKTIQFLLSSNLSEVFSIFFATIAGFVLFQPVHLLFINLITDSLPAVALGMEPAQPGIMKHKPRGQNEGIFSGGLGVDLLYQGILVTVFTLLAYFIVQDYHFTETLDAEAAHNLAMTGAFLTLSMCEIFHAYNMRSQRQSIFSLRKQNMVLWGAMALSLVLTLLVIYVPPLAAIFQLQPLGWFELVVSLGLSIAIIPVVEVVKAVQRAVTKK